MRVMMAKSNYYTRAFMALAAVAVLAMLLLAAARPALAQTIEVPANNSTDTDGDLYFEGYVLPGAWVELFEGENQVGISGIYECQYWGTYVYNCWSWGVSLTDVADGTHTYYAVATDDYGNALGQSDTVTVVVDKTMPPTVNNIEPAGGSDEHLDDGAT